MGIRKSWSILENCSVLKCEKAKDHSEAGFEADIIMTATILGFSAGRLAVGHPVQFDSKEKEDEKLKRVVKKLNDAIGSTYPKISKHVSHGVTPPWKEGGMITGAPGASALEGEDRRDNPNSEAAKELHSIASKDDRIGYQGRGAYTGFVDDQLNNRASIKSTMRYNVPRHQHGERWRPPTVPLDSENQKFPWGLLKNEPGHVEETMAEESYDGNTDGIVGYTHGMVQAIYDCVMHGPWCRPFEIAVGEKTRKLASCLQCTLFMYAAGYPPSSIHLGQGASWLPFYPSDNFAPRTAETIRSINSRWHLECEQHLAIGLEILSNPKSKIRESHAQKLPALKAFLSKNAERLNSAANLILDASTVHSREDDRIDRTLAT